MKRFLLVLVLAFAFFPAAASAQEFSKPAQNPKTTQAFSLLIQQKVKLQAELENLLSEYTSDWPKSKRIQFELDTLKSEMKKMAEVEEPQVSKLSAGYGQLVLRRIVLAADVHMLSEEEGSDWPPLKQKQRELELLDKEIQKVMR
jgi:hypothetical protein